MIIEVSDIFDAFHQIAQIIWSMGEFQGSLADKNWQKSNRIGVSFDGLVDNLEQDFFGGACARRVFLQSGKNITSDEAINRLRLHDIQGNILPDEEMRFSNNAFDWGSPEDAEVDNSIIGGNSVPVSRQEVRLFIHL